MNTRVMGPALSPISFAIFIITLVALTGLALGSLRFRGVGIGTAGVLFTGLVFGNLGASIDQGVAEFAKEFGLILFVSTIGLQLGPGIVQLWKRQGLRLNALAVSIVVQGALLVILFLFTLKLPVVAAAGLFSGATTNTPSLGAAEQAATMVFANQTDSQIGSLTAAYAVAYPGGIMGIIASMLIIRRIFRIDVKEEVRKAEFEESIHNEPIERRAIVVDNRHFRSVPFNQIPGIEETRVRLSRILRANEGIVHPANEQTCLQEKDVIQVVGPRSGLDRFTPVIGHPSEIDLMTSAGDADFRRICVTDAMALNKTLRELSLDQMYNATITRIYRTGVEMPARASSKLHFGDIVQVVGDRRSLDRASKFLGNSSKSLSETRFMPLFVCIALGIILGMTPLPIPGMPFPVRLGLAGGPLIAAIAFSLVGSVGNFVWYVPPSANRAMRELGIILFLACAGLAAGPAFFHSAASADGAKWMVAGICVTMIPLLTTGMIGRFWGKLDYLTICGVIAGSMTDPPALAFANSQSESETSSTAYAAVYPLTMILRIIAAQSIVFFFAG
ncbi:MAG: putative transporter [Pirellulaceae bacterium]